MKVSEKHAALINPHAMRLIQKCCKGRKHIRLTVGVEVDGERSIAVFGESGQVDNENYIYEIGSIGKTITATLLSSSIHEHKMSLDDSIQKYFDGLDAERYYPTLRRLATHTSGYSGRLPLTRRQFLKMYLDVVCGLNQGILPLHVDLERMKAFVQNTRLQDKDYKWAYSNFGFGLIGYAIGVVAGRSYQDTMDEFLVKELGLNTTYVGITDRNLHGFSRRNQDCGNWMWQSDNLMGPAGAISSTADDLLTYASLNMNEELPYLSLCHQKHAHQSKKYDMGLGWFLHKENNKVMHHEGGTGAFGSFLALDKEKKVAVVVLANYKLWITSESSIGLSILESLQRNHGYVI